MNLKPLLLIVFCLCVPLAAFAAPSSKPAEVAGAWSATVDGVQGRLIVTPYSGKNDATRVMKIYLELRNISDIVSPIGIRYDSTRGMTLEVVDDKGTRPRQMGFAMSEVTSGPYELALPNDSTLQFLVSHSGYTIPTGAGIYFELGGTQGAAFVPDAAKQPYFLRGTFTATMTHRFDVAREWHSTLSLPPVPLARLLSP